MLECIDSKPWVFVWQMRTYATGPGQNKFIFTQVFYTQRPNNKEITIKSCLVTVCACKALPPALRRQYSCRLCSYMMLSSLRWVLTWPIFSSLYRLLSVLFIFWFYYLTLCISASLPFSWLLLHLPSVLTLCSFLFLERGGVDCFP